MTDLPALERYRTHAVRLGKRFQDITSETVLRSITGHLPERPARILDVGAGSGRDACWFAVQGHDVTAVDVEHEPVTQTA